MDELLVPLAAFALGIVVFGSVGRLRERRHLRDLAAREAAVAHVMVTDLRSLPPGIGADGIADARLVLGEVVIAGDYLKAFLARVRNVFGGEMRSYRTLLERARREARLRMLDEALAVGATLVINVRFETSQIGTASTSAQAMPTTEILCAGTAVVPAAP